MFLISYSISVVIKNTITNEKVTLIKEYKDVEVLDTSTNMSTDNVEANTHEVALIDINSEFKDKIALYAATNNIKDVSVLQIEEYNIYSNDNKIKMYFENPNQDNSYTLVPIIMCYVEPTNFNSSFPTLSGEALSDNSIKWSWSDEESKIYSHIITDENKNIIAQLPLYINEYIETNLTPNTSYTRMLVRLQDNSYSDYSIPVTTKTLINSIISLSTFKEQIPKDYIPTYKNDYFSDTKYFQSGIGDKNDLMISKQSMEDFYDKYNLFAFIKGNYTSSAAKYGQVSFDYRLKASCDYTAKTKEGYISFNASAYPICILKYTVYKRAYKPVTIHWKIRGYAVYYDGQTPKTKIIDTDPFEYKFLGPISKDKQVIISKNIRGKNVTIGTIMKWYLDNDDEVNKNVVSGGAGGFYYRYEVLSDYHFDTVDKYNTNPNDIHRKWDIGLIGSIKILPHFKNNGTINEDDYVYCYGYSDANAYMAHKSKAIEITRDIGECALINKDDLTINEPLKNIAGEEIPETYTPQNNVVESHNVIKYSNTNSDRIMIVKPDFYDTESQSLSAEVKVEVTPEQEQSTLSTMDTSSLDDGYVYSCDMTSLNSISKFTNIEVI